jgi:uncharacterized protein YjlB
VRAQTWVAPAGEQIPNHPSFAVLIYREVSAVAAGADSCRELFAEHDWVGSWVDGVFDFHHFHSTSHEVLGVVAGEATLELGGPQGRNFDVSAGDVLVLPAGTGHRRASARSASQWWAPTREARRTTTCSAAGTLRRSPRRGSK